MSDDSMSDDSIAQFAKERARLMEMYGAGGRFIIGSFGFQPAPPKDEKEQLRDQVKAYADAFEKLRKQACQLATVQTVGREKTTLLVSGKPIEVESVPEIKPGDTVRVVNDTMQIMGRAAEPPATGEVVVVTRVSGKSGVCEVDRAGASRAVSYGCALEEGDRVVLDSTGSVVIANLGKPPTECVLTAPTGVTWDDIGGLEDAKRQMREAVEAPTKHRDVFERYGKRAARGVLLYGPSGCGKTLLGKAAATAMAEVHGKAAQGAFFYVKGPELLNMFVGNTEQRIRELFASARRHKKQHGFPAIIFIDEADSILGKRGGFGFGLEKTIVPQFLAEMDGLDETGAFVLIATNLPGSLDPAIIRDGRLDRRIKVGRPKLTDARAIFAKHLASGKPLAGSVEEFAEAGAQAVFDPARIMFRIKKHSSVGDGVPMTFGHIANGALIAGIVDRATSAAMHREIAGGEANVVLDDLKAAVCQAMAEMMDVNLEDDLEEFCEGWRHEVCGVTKVGGARVRTIVDRNVS